ncbi:hypothetical protein DL771_004976 [Monosporascus sp. 5C6A]|nr:hypothetical protein DL771_004976 [Monosporascus sp. 5C6A]
MAEIEHCVDPKKKEHPRFGEVGEIELALLNREMQAVGKTTPQCMTVGQAVKSKTIENEMLGCFLAEIMLLLLKIGVDPSKLRFRQHMANEVAHYACDCWDVELLTSYDWVECVGCAGRSAFDFTAHPKYTGAPLSRSLTLFDASGASIGKECVRNDELGTPLGITIDFGTLCDGSVTLREQDSSMKQVRGSEDDVVQVVKLLMDGVESWEQISHRLLPFSGQGHDN